MAQFPQDETDPQCDPKMKILSVSEAQANLLNLLEQVNEDHLPRQITSRKGKAVLLSKEDWDSLQETLYAGLVVR
ncbi:MAG: type II toxin-antitoxin system Phd/YefM family antitoxin [Cyanobacteria bacterium J06626_18]